MEKKEKQTEVKEKTTEEKFNKDVEERNNIDMKIYNVPKEYAVKFKRFADSNGMKFNAAIMLLLERLDYNQKLEELETVIFRNAKLIDDMYEVLQSKADENKKTEDKPEKKDIKTYGK